jgi:hypothetical protein
MCEKECVFYAHRHCGDRRDHPNNSAIISELSAVPANTSLSYRVVDRLFED